MRRFIMIMALVAITMISGCGLAYTAKRNELLKTAQPSDYGPPPPANYCEIQKQFLSTLLKDSQSAQYQWGSNSAREIIQDDIASPNPILVWITTAQINARNSYGGYTGFKPYLFAWRDEKIYAVAFPDQWGRPGFWHYYGR